LNPLFHLAEPSAWSARDDHYRPDDLDDVGFVHCSTAEQLNDMARHFYPDRDDLVLLTIDPDAVSDNLVFEDIYQAGEEFPHVYGPIPLAAVLSSEPYTTPR
jgi:uncharacterized protein (DUF952 family)